MGQGGNENADEAIAKRHIRSANDPARRREYLREFEQDQNDSLRAKALLVVLAAIFVIVVAIVGPMIDAAG